MGIYERQSKMKMMKRTKKKTKMGNCSKPDAILTSDWHLRETTPICRTDDFWKMQWQKVDWIAELQRKYYCPVFHAGDLFHHWKPSPYLLSMTMEHLPDGFCTVYGQHDLPGHSLELKEKSGIYTLEKAGKLKVLDEANWGQKPDKGSYLMPYTDRLILVWHNFTYVGKDPWPGVTSPKAHILLRKYKQFDLIVTGDNHQSFTVNGHQGNLLVNPGNLTRQTADQIDFQPKLYLWYAETNTVEAVDVPIQKDVITREHIDRVDAMDKKIEAFISRFKEEWEKNWEGQLAGVPITFEEKLDQFFESNRVRKQVKNIIYKAMEEKK